MARFERLLYDIKNLGILYLEAFLQFYGDLGTLNGFPLEFDV